MGKVIIIGGGWAGCAAALSAVKAGAEVQLLERTDMLLGLGNVGGIMRNNGRFTAAEENIAMGAGELFEITDRLATHRNIDFPGHRHASFYDVTKVEPEVRRLLMKMKVRIGFQTRVTDVKMDNSGAGRTADGANPVLIAEGTDGANPVLIAEGADNNAGRTADGAGRILAVSTADGETFEGDVFIDCTGTTGPMGNCMEFGNGCSMCILRCPSFGPRVSISAKAGGHDYWECRADGTPGAFSGSCKLEKNSLSKDIQKLLRKNGVAIIPLPEALINERKLSVKVCRQYALPTFAENIILIDTGYAKMMTPFFSLEELRMVKGFENVRFVDPYAGGKGNSVRYLAITERDRYMRVRGVANLFCAGEKAGPYIGHTEAISTGLLAGYNAALYSGAGNSARTAEGFEKNAARTAEGAGQGSAGTELLALPETTAIGAFLEYKKSGGGMITFAGDDFFKHMKRKGLYSTDRDAVKRRIEAAGLTDIYENGL